MGRLRVARGAWRAAGIAFTEPGDADLQDTLGRSKTSKTGHAGRL
jgi:hypothetical protein